MERSCTECFRTNAAVVVRHGTIWYNMAQHGTTWHNMAQHGTTWHNMARYGRFFKPNQNVGAHASLYFSMPEPNVPHPAAHQQGRPKGRYRRRPDSLSGGRGATGGTAAATAAAAAAGRGWDDDAVHAIQRYPGQRCSGKCIAEDKRSGLTGLLFEPAAVTAMACRRPRHARWYRRQPHGPQLKCPEPWRYFGGGCPSSAPACSLGGCT